MLRTLELFAFANPTFRKAYTCGYSYPTVSDGSIAP